MPGMSSKASLELYVFETNGGGRFMVVGDEQFAGDIECCGVCVIQALRTLLELPSVLWRPSY